MDKKVVLLLKVR